MTGLYLPFVRKAPPPTPPPSGIARIIAWVRRHWRKGGK